MNNRSEHEQIAVREGGREGGTEKEKNGIKKKGIMISVEIKLVHMNDRKKKLRTDERKRWSARRGRHRRTTDNHFYLAYLT